jgi:HD-GYP domain-containing protein (c-di-GMP phosphodiesterase class II)
MKKLFYALIKSIATAIDEKSPYTGGHIKRVVELTMLIVDKINEINEGHFKAIHFNEDEKIDNGLYYDYAKKIYES